MGKRDRWLARALLALTDTVGEAFDLDSHLAGLAATYRDLLRWTDAGVVLAGDDRRAARVAATSQRVRVLQQLEAAQGAGPGTDACRRGEQVVNVVLGDRARRPRLVPPARAVGVHALHAFPLRYRDDPIGAVTVYCRDDHRLTPGERDAAQALADAASIGVVQARSAARSRELAAQLQTALSSRVAIEQAKGVLAERLAVPMDDAFTLLRRHARSHRRRLDSVAKAVVLGTMSATELRVASRRLEAPGAA